MKKIYSNLFADKNSGKNREVKNPKLRVSVFFILSILSNFLVWVLGGKGTKFYFFNLKKSFNCYLKREINFFELCNATVAPLDSFRYFEFHYADTFTKDIKVESYLDVSSPRLFPAYLLQSRNIGNACILNPDKNDIEGTRSMFRKFKIKGKYEFFNELIESSNFKKESFDFISSISVIEHIPLDVAEKTIEILKSLLRPGGYLLISVPVAAEGFEEYINWNEYGLQDTSKDGYYFGQRFYDQSMLDKYFNGPFGKPVESLRIYGERKQGFFFENRFQKLNYKTFPFWKEGWLFFKNYKQFQTIQEMPGIGVAIFLYRK